MAAALKAEEALRASTLNWAKYSPQLELHQLVCLAMWMLGLCKMLMLREWRMGRPFWRYSLRIFEMRWRKPWIAFVLPEHLFYMCRSLNRRQYTVLNTKSWDLGFKAARFRNWSLFDFSLVGNITDHGRRSYQIKRRISVLSSNNNLCWYLCTRLDVIYFEPDGWGLLALEKRLRNIFYNLLLCDLACLPLYIGRIPVNCQWVSDV